jgi:hypothetical protein
MQTFENKCYGHKKGLNSRNYEDDERGSEKTSVARTR